MWQTPITDRTLADVEFANANRDSPEPLKGMRNASDLNRISNNMRYISNLLLLLGIATPEITCKCDWLITDFPRESDIRKYQTDLNALRTVGNVLTTTPLTPDLPYTHYQKLNDIEQIIHDLHIIIGRVVNSFIGTGEIGCGELS